MPVRTAEAEWKGNLPEGSGTLRSESGALEGAYSFRSRFQEGDGTNPEELIGAAHAGCFSMALANKLAEAGFEPESIRTTARVKLEKGGDGFSITGVDLISRVRVPDVDDETLREHAEAAKAGCPVSRALKAIDIAVDVTLER